MSIAIKLNQAEYSYLCKASFLPDRLRQLFFLTERAENAYLLNISEDQADEIRDLCGEQLQVVGFDEKYEPTPEGEILEDLVDKFYIG
ncbi:MAG: hypothetical protein WDZ28_00100 [Simkaniaceae bacterium]